MMYYTFLLLTISSTIVTSEEINGLDENVFQQVQNVHKATGFKEGVFVQAIWSELSMFLPESAKVPGLELKFKPSTDEDLKVASNSGSDGTVKGTYWYDNYICTFESRIYPKLAETVSTEVITFVDGKPIQRPEGKVVVEVNAKFSMNGRSMDYNLFQKEGGTNDAIGPIPVNYRFDEKSKVQLILDIPDFSMISTLSDAHCLVNIRGVEITELSSPTLINNLNEKQKKTAEDFWKFFAVKVQGMQLVMSAGVRRAINLKLKDKATYWICLSEEFKKDVAKDEELYRYNTIYDEYCKDSKIAD